MGASGKRHADGAGGDLFDVRVVAFAGGSAQTLKALQDLFGLDREAAQRLVDNVPMVVRRAAPANEANNYVEALRSIGAEVSLERPGNTNAGERPVLAKAPPPPPPKAVKAPPPPPKPTVPKMKAPPPPPRDADALPRPVMRAPTADLEFDLFAGRGGAEPAVAHANPEPAYQSPPADSKRTTAMLGRSAGKRERSEFEFNAGANAGRLELDVDAVRTSPVERAEKPSAGSRDHDTLEIARPAAAVSGDATAARSNAELGRGPGPMSRAAVVHKPGPASLEPVRRRRQLSLLRMLGAVSLAAGGVWLDSSIVYGNANLFSVFAHAVAIYQFGVGLRGMVS